MINESKNQSYRLLAVQWNPKQNFAWPDPRHYVFWFDLETKLKVIELDWFGSRFSILKYDKPNWQVKSNTLLTPHIITTYRLYSRYIDAIPKTLYPRKYT